MTDRADVVVQWAGSRATGTIRDGIQRVVAGIGLLGDDLTVVIACAGAGDGEATESPGGPAAIVPIDTAPLDRIPMITALPRDPYRTLFTLGRRHDARALLMLGTGDDQLTPGMVASLVRPLIADAVDVVTPGYQRQIFDGLLNAAVVSPLTRTLYGRRVNGQLGLDFGFSARVAQRWGIGDEEVPVTRPVWLLPQAVADDMHICEVPVPVRLPPTPESIDLSALLSHVLGSLFTDLEPRAPFWQRVVRSRAVPAIGRVDADADATATPVDVRPMIDSFGLAYRNLQSVWPLVLPPATLVELKRLTLADPARFRLDDGLWARIVYDFALAHRLRTINREHLLRAFVPLYLAWVASYATDAQRGTRAMADARLEQLCQAFEHEKPYLVRRWRWPDRFNP